MIDQIEIKNYFGMFELKKRLRNVRLKGFPDVKIYEDAKIQIENRTPEEIKTNIFIPQPTIYRKGFLNKIDRLAKVFSAKGIDIFNLNGGVDYTAYSNGDQTDWTIIPPIVEVIPINFTNGHLNYAPWLSKELQELMEKTKCGLNPELIMLSYHEYPRSGLHPIQIICDGSHRVHSGLEKRIPQNLLFIESPKKEFPYYAAPQPYSSVHVENKRPKEGATTKVHVLESPAHKSLYRLFPTGGILNGTVRPE
ncbi:MAG: hypothetical protein V1888_03425 [archaeon]